MHSHRKAFTKYFVLQSLHKALPSATLYKACTKYSPLLLSTTKLAQSTPQYYFVLQSLHKPLPSTTLYYKACTKHSPLLLSTTKLAQSTPQYNILQSLHKPLPSTTLYCKACAKHFPLLLSTTKLAQSTPQYNILQSLHKPLPSTTLYCKACAKHFPVLVCIAKLAHTSTAAHTRYLPSPAATTLHGKTHGFVLRLPPQHKSHATFMQPLQCVLQHHVHTNAAITVHCDLHPSVAEHQGGADWPRNDPNRNRHTHTRYPSSPPAATLHRKTARFCAPASRPKPAPCNSHAAITVCFAAPRTHPCTKGGNRLTSKRSKPQPPQTQGTLHCRLQPLHTEKRTVSCRLPPQNQPHATVMQPLQCVSQHHVSNPHVLTHMATKRDNNHAAIARRSASTDCKTPCNYAAHMHSDTLQNTKGEPIRARHDRSRARRTRTTRYLSSPAAATLLHGKMQGFALRLHLQHNTNPMQQSCSHYNAFCSITCLTCMSRHTWQQNVATIMKPLHGDLQAQIAKHPIKRYVAERQGRTDSRPEQPQPHPKNHKVSCPGFLPNPNPMQHSCSHYSHHFPKSSLPFVTTSVRHHFPYSHHFPCHHFPSSPLPFVATSLGHHFPKSPLPLDTTSQSHHIPFVTTSLGHHFPRLPLPFVTTSLRHHFPRHHPSS